MRTRGGGCLRAPIRRAWAACDLLHYDTKAGHSRGFNTPVTKQIEDLTDELSFLFAQTGAKYEPAEKPAKPPAEKKAA